MVAPWGGFSNGQIPLSAMKQVLGQWFEPDMADRMTWLHAQTGISCQEGYRPLGVPNDQYIRNESQTSTGGSNQWFQWGRYKRGETPSAGTPGTSSHGWGLAADITPGRENAAVRDACAKVGLIFTVSSESWHVAADGTPTVDYKPQENWRKTMRLVGCNQNGGHWIMAPGYIKQVNFPAAMDQAAVALAGPFVVYNTSAEVEQVCAALDIPVEVYRALDKQPNRQWSRENEILAAIKGITGGSGGASADQIAKAVDAVLKDDFAAVPKAVNDDAAKRMSS